VNHRVSATSNNERVKKTRKLDSEFFYASYVHQNPTGGSRWIVQSQATEGTKDSPQSHRRQEVVHNVSQTVPELAVVRKKLVALDSIQV